MTTAIDAVPAELELLLEYLRRARGFDFTAYKRPSLGRRIERRMQAIGVATFPDYIDYLEVHPGEFPQLFNTILINVTAFFRDPPCWDYLATEIVPRILEERGPGDAIRVWSAGCASGEEAYTLAMLFHEALGAPAFRERVKIYASNVDEIALAKARQAAYTMHEVEGVPRELLGRYFDLNVDRYVVHKELRRAVIFGRHDLIQDAPISRIDLLVCRNTLMYFNAETQAQILARFHFALNERGFLFLGKAEMLLNHGHVFVPVDLKRRVFAKHGDAALRDRLLVLAHAERGDRDGSIRADHLRLRDSAFDADVVAQLVIDSDGRLVLANEPARLLFGLSLEDVGRPMQELELANKPIELRGHIDQALSDRRAAVLRDVVWPGSDGEARVFSVRVLPLIDGPDSPAGAKVLFIDVSNERRLEDGMLQLRQNIETLREELETTNEELQSTNEELETMNEELQSSNEELRTMNEEIIRRGDELNQVNAFLESILTSLRGAVIVIDRDQRIQVWNDRAENLWGLRADEVHGKSLLGLDIGFPVDLLAQPIRACLRNDSGHHRFITDATNRRGRKIRCAVTCTPLLGLNREIRGVILLMEDTEAAEQE